MTTTQHSNQLLEELVAEEIGYQIDQIAEDLQGKAGLSPW